MRVTGEGKFNAWVKVEEVRETDATDVNVKEMCSAQLTQKQEKVQVSETNLVVGTKNRGS